MTKISAMMDLIENKIVYDKSYKMKNFYKMVEENLKLDLEDNDPAAPGAGSVKSAFNPTISFIVPPFKDNAVVLT